MEAGQTGHSLQSPIVLCGDWTSKDFKSDFFKKDNKVYGHGSIEGWFNTNHNTKGLWTNYHCGVTSSHSFRAPGVNVECPPEGDHSSCEGNNWCNGTLQGDSEGGTVGLCGLKHGFHFGFQLTYCKLRDFVDFDEGIWKDMKGYEGIWRDMAGILLRICDFLKGPWKFARAWVSALEPTGVAYPNLTHPMSMSQMS